MLLRRSLGRPKKDLANAPEDNNVVRYQGISTVFLQELLEDLLNDRIAIGLQLFTLTGRLQLREKGVTLQPGTTVRLKKAFRNGKILCLVPYVGLFTLLSRELLEPKLRHEWTIEDVCEYIVLEETRDTKCFYLDLIPQEYVGERFQGAFISQARKSNFRDLVFSITRWNADAFVWLDVFCANQPLLTSRESDMPQDILIHREVLLKHGLHDALRCFDIILVYFNSWSRPYPLSRAWCVWEILGADKSGKEIALLFKPGERESFLHTLQNKREQIAKNIANISLEKAQCFNAKDKRDIDEQVEQHGGYHKLNVRISGLIQTWIRRFAKDAVARAKADESISKPVLGKLLFDVAAMWSDHGDLEAAGDQFYEVLKIYGKIYGKRRHPNVAAARGELAKVFTRQGKYDDALKQYEKASKIYQGVYGSCEHPNVINVWHNVANVMIAQGQFSLALEKLEKLFQVEHRLYGKLENPNIANTKRCIGSVIASLGDYERAHFLVQESLHLYECCSETETVNVGIALHEKAKILEALGDLEEALELYLTVLRICEKAYGSRKNAFVAACLCRIGTVKCKLGDVKEGVFEYLKVAEDVLVAEQRYLLWLYTGLGIGYRLMNLDEKALGFLEKALALLENENDLRATEVLFEIAIITSNRTLFQKILRIRRENLTLNRDGDRHPRIREVLVEMETCP